MSETFYTLLTKAGQAQFANATTFGTKVNFTKFKVGDGNGSYYEPTETQTDLVNTVWTGYINSINVDPDNANWIVIEAVIPTNVGDFTVRELGLYDDADNLLAVSKCAETYKPIITDGSTKELVMKVVLAVSNTSAVTLKVDPTMIFATKSDIDAIDKRLDADEIILNGKLDKIDYVRAGGFAITTGTSTAYIVNTTPAPTSYTDGMQITIMPHVDCGTNPTLNWNGLGAGTILNNDGTAINVGDIKANKPLSLVRVGSSFFISSSNKTTYFDRLYTQNPWKYCDTLPRGRIGSVCEIVNGKLYIFGGTNYTTVVDVLDIVTNTWTTTTNMPYGVSYASSVQYNGNIYIVGGVTSGGSIPPIQIYNPSTNTWTTTASGVYVGSEGCAETYNGKIYYLGGTYGSWDILSIYDIASNTWTTGATMPSGYGRINACSGIVNGVIYLIGGNNNTNFTDVLGYNISSNYWGIVCNTPKSIDGTILPLIYGGADTYNGKIYVVGGQNKTSTYNPYENQLWILDVTSKTWTKGIGMPTGRISPAVCVYDKKLFVAGGETTIINDSMRLEICVLG